LRCRCVVTPAKNSLSSGGSLPVKSRVHDKSIRAAKDSVVVPPPGTWCPAQPTEVEVQLTAGQSQLHGVGEPLVDHGVLHPTEFSERDVQLVEWSASAAVTRRGRQEIFVGGDRLSLPVVQGDSVDGDKGVAPPAPEDGSARDIKCREEGHVVAQDGVAQLA
jgi:hypothetical protein